MSIKYFGDGSANNMNSHKRIASYTYNGNAVIVPTSVDTATGIFTVSGGGLNAIFAGFGAGTDANGVSKNTILPRTKLFATNSVYREFIGANTHLIQVLSDTTFMVWTGTTSATVAAISSYTNANDSGVVLSNLFFEVYPYSNTQPTTIDLSAFSNLTEIVVKVSSPRERNGWSYIYLNGTYGDGTSNFSQVVGTGPDGRAFEYIYMEQHFRYDPGSKILTGVGVQQANVFWNESNGTWSLSNAIESDRNFWYLDNFKITGVKVFFPMGNGATIDIYDVRGS